MTAGSRVEPATIGGRYLPGPLLALGGGATVERAHDARLDRSVAVKRPLPGDPAAAERLRHEVAVLTRCAHPGVVACLDGGEDEAGAPYLVLEWLGGANLVQHAEAGRITPSAARAWAAEIERAVAHLHARGIVHGDLKPQHVVIARDGRAVLVDLDHAEVGGDRGRDRAALVALLAWIEAVGAGLAPAWPAMLPAAAGEADGTREGTG